jgi:hypothetical protein
MAGQTMKISHGNIQLDWNRPVVLADIQAVVDAGTEMGLPPNAEINYISFTTFNETAALNVGWRMPRQEIEVPE